MHYKVFDLAVHHDCQQGIGFLRVQKLQQSFETIE